MVTNKVCWSVFTDSEETQIEEALSQPTSTEALDAYGAEKVKELSDEHRRATLIRYEQTAEIIRQRDLAVDVLKTAYEVGTNHDDRLPFDWAVYCEMRWQGIKESEEN